MHGCISDLGHPGVGAVGGHVMHCAVHCIAVMHGCISDLGHPGVRAALCGDAGHGSDAVMHGCISDLGHPGVRAVGGHVMQCIAAQ